MSVAVYGDWLTARQKCARHASQLPSGRHKTMWRDSSGKQPHRLVEAFQHVISPAIPDHASGAIADRRRDKNLARLCHRLRSRRAVHHGPDGGEIAMRPAKLAKVGVSTVDADPDADFNPLGAQADQAREFVASIAKASLDVAGGKNGLCDVICLPNGEVEDRKHRVTDRLVQ